MHTYVFLGMLLLDQLNWFRTYTCIATVTLYNSYRFTESIVVVSVALLMYNIVLEDSSSQTLYP